MRIDWQPDGTHQDHRPARCRWFMALLLTTTTIPLTFLDPINSFAAMGYWKFEGKCPHRWKMLITWLFVPENNQNKNIKSTYRRVQNLRISFKKIVQTSDPWGTNLWPKFEILTVLGAVLPYFCPDKREIWHGERTEGNVSPLRGEKPIFGPLSKNKSGIAALRAGLPVTKKTSHFFVYSRHATHDPHYLALW